jgi:hypothetical protein
MCGKRVNDVVPDLPLQSIKACWRLGATLSGNKGYD